jgi:signal transduction histidine kinase
VVDLNEIVRSTVALGTLRPLKTTLIDVREHYSTDVPLIVANRDQIQQIVLNLVLNAEHVLRETGRRGEIFVRTGGTDDSAFVEVSDDGPGVSAEVAGRIFEPFFTTKPVGEGTGLGLSVSLGIAHAHSGSLELIPGARGASFRLTLPAAAVARLDLSALPVIA